MHKPTDAKIARVIENLNFNIRMFESYADGPTQVHTDHKHNTLARLRQSLDDVQRMAQGTLAYQDMSYDARDRFFEMPAWGTYGT